MSARTMVSEIYNTLKSQEGAGGQPRAVSVARTLSPAEYTLTVSQAQNRSASLLPTDDPASHICI
jgi:hypothetical protein